MKNRHKMASKAKKMDYVEESSKIEKEAGLRKHGGKVARHKSGGVVAGASSAPRMDKRARGGAIAHKKSGGRANATMNPYSSAKI